MFQIEHRGVKYGNILLLDDKHNTDHKLNSTTLIGTATKLAEGHMVYGIFYFCYIKNNKLKNIRGVESENVLI